jgi:hypothetical protein
MTSKEKLESYASPEEDIPFEAVINIWLEESYGITLDEVDESIKGGLFPHRIENEEFFEKYPVTKDKWYEWKNILEENIKRIFSIDDEETINFVLEPILLHLGPIKIL